MLAKINNWSVLKINILQTKNKENAIIYFKI